MNDQKHILSEMKNETLGKNHLVINSVNQSRNMYQAPVLSSSGSGAGIQ